MLEDRLPMPAPQSSRLEDVQRQAQFRNTFRYLERGVRAVIEDASADNLPSSREVGRRSVVLIATEFLLRGLLGLVLLCATQTLPPTTFGQLVYLISLLLLVTVIGDFGLTTYLLRAAGSASVSRAMLIRASGLRVVFTLAATAGAALLLHERDAASDLWIAFGLGSIGVILRSPAEMAWSVLRGQGKVRLDARVRLVSMALFLTALGLAVIWARNLVPFGAAWIVWGLASLVVTATVMPAMKLGQAPTYSELARGSWPYATLALLVTVYFRIDQLMLGNLSTDSEAGAYGAAFFVMEALFLVPVATTYALVPAFAAAWAHGDDRALIELTTRTRRPLAMLGLGLVTLSAGVAPAAIPQLLGPDYLRTVDVWAVLAWTIPVVYVSSVHAALISAGPRPQLNTGIAAFMTVENVFLNLWAIPAFGAVGAAWTTLATELTGLCLNTLAMRRLIGRANPVLAIAIVGAVIGLLVLDLRLGIFIGLLILAAGSIDTARLLRGR